jgi:Ca-activated chloride channel family protein
MELKNPEMLWLLLIVLPMIAVYWRRERSRRPAVQFSTLSLFESLPRTPLVRLRHVPFVLRLLALSLLIVALARPRKGVSEQEVTTEGVDIMLVLDLSTSMRALDFKPLNRLHVAKETIKTFVLKRQHDRIGLVAFAGRSYTKCPLTLDYAMLTQLIDELDFNQVEDGTAIGTALATAANRIASSKARSRVIILLTDGVNNKGEIAPMVAAEAAAQLGVKIYTIGVGREGQVPYPVEMHNPWTGETQTQVQMVDSDLDEEVLSNIATLSGGEFFRAHNAETLKEIYERINELEKTQIKTMTYTTYSEKFFVWLLAGAALLLVEVVLSHTIFRRIP